MLSGIALAACAAFAKGFEQVIHRSVVKTQDPLSYAFLWNLLLALLYLPLALAEASAPRDLLPWGLLIASSALWAAAAYTGFRAYSLLDVSYVSPLTKLRVALVLLLCAVFLNESLPTTKLTGTALLLLGVVVLANPMSIRWREGAARGTLHALATAALVAGALVIDKRATPYFGPGTYSFLVFLLPSIMLLPFIRGRLHKIRQVLTSSAKPLLVAASLSAVSYYLTLAAFRREQASVVIPIVETHVLVSVGLGVIVLRERKNVGRKLGASLLVILGAVVLSGRFG